MYFVHFRFKESGAKHKGLIEMPNLSEENEVDDTQVRDLPVSSFFFNESSFYCVYMGHLKNRLLDCDSRVVVLVDRVGFVCRGRCPVGVERSGRKEEAQPPQTAPARCHAAHRHSGGSG